jgi:thiol-disulfide isomerase/thioredoxin
MRPAILPVVLVFLLSAGVPAARHVPAQDTASAEPVLLEYKGKVGTFRKFDSLFETRRRHEVGGVVSEFSFERRARTTVYTYDITPEGTISVCGEIVHEPARLKACLKDGRNADPADLATLEKALPRAGCEIISYGTNKWGVPLDEKPTDDLPACVIQSLSAVEQLPARSVRPGDKWTREEKRKLMNCRYEFSFVRTEEKNGFTCALIESVVNLECLFVRQGAKAYFENGGTRMWFAVKEGMPVLVEGRITFKTEAGGQKDELELASRVEFVDRTGVEPAKAAELARQATSLVGVNGMLQDGILDAAYLGLVSFKKKYPDSPWKASVSHIIGTIETEFPLLLKEAPELEVAEWVVPLPQKGSGTVVPATPLPPLKSLRGKVVLIEFWASWSPPCRETAPLLLQWHESYSGRDLVVIGITACDSKTANVQKIENVCKFVEDNRIKYSIGIEGGNRATSRKYGVALIPCAFLVDRAGKVRWQGNTARKENVETMIQKLLQER